MDKKSLEIKWKHYEEKRKERVHMVRDERLRVLEDEKRGLIFYDVDGTIKVCLYLLEIVA
jgi:hypothetical protein